MEQPKRRISIETEITDRKSFDEFKSWVSRDTLNHWDMPDQSQNKSINPTDYDQLNVSVNG